MESSSRNFGEAGERAGLKKNVKICSNPNVHVLATARQCHIEIHTTVITSKQVSLVPQAQHGVAFAAWHSRTRQYAKSLQAHPKENIGIHNPT
jgi:hypothetical protein